MSALSEHQKRIDELFRDYDTNYADSAMESQSKFVESIRKQYEEKGTLSEKQIEVFEKINEQIDNYDEDFNRAFTEDDFRED